MVEITLAKRESDKNHYVNLTEIIGLFNPAMIFCGEPETVCGGIKSALNGDEN